ncbi:MAG: hypothetical protein IKY83_11105 [Proteobacteria bacterium]|nr:hypothetical protein [Pseudomonadota bacterium]
MACSNNHCRHHISNKEEKERKRACELNEIEAEPLYKQACNKYNKLMTEYIKKLNLPPVIIYEAYSDKVDSPHAGGVNIKFICTNPELKIKYVYFKIRGYNRVDDPIHPNNPDEEDEDRFDAKLRSMGPYPDKSPKTFNELIELIDKYKSNRRFDCEYPGWDNIFNFKSPPEYVIISKIRVVYKDNSEETFISQNLKTALKDPVPQPPDNDYHFGDLKRVENKITYLRSYIDNPPYYK